MRRTVLRLVWPVIIQNLLITLYFFTDRVMVGRVGETALAAVGIAGPILWSVSMVLMAIGVGTMACVARAVGGGDHAKAQANAATGLSLSLLGGIAVSVAGILLAGPLIRLWIDEPDVVLEGSFYFGTIIAAFSLTFLGMVAANILRAAGDTRTPMLVGILSNSLNIFGNYALIFGKFGMPEMGLTGAGLATALSKTLESLLLLLHIFSARSAVHLRFRSFLMVTKQTIWRVVKVSLPAAVEPLFVHSGFLTFTKIVAMMGKTAVAAHTIAIGIESIGFMTAEAFYAVTAAIVGQSLGAGRKDLAEMGARESMRISVFMLTGAAIVFLLLPQYLARIFTDDLNLITVAAICVAISALEQPFLAIANIYKGAFQGAGDTRTPAIVGALSVWIVRVPVAYFLAIVLGWGLVGIWVTTIADWGVRASIYFFIFRRGKWKDTKI